MKTSIVVTSVALLSLLLLSCSSVMPSPELEITEVSPPALTTGTTINITFNNMNSVDAIIKSQRVILKGAVTDTINSILSFYVQAKTDAVLAVVFTDIAALRTAIGFDTAGNRTMTFYFSGTDAYGYDKTFTVREFTVSF